MQAFYTGTLFRKLRAKQIIRAAGTKTGGRSQL
jgi:hypothetical protein